MFKNTNEKKEKGVYFDSAMYFLNPLEMGTFLCQQLFIHGLHSISNEEAIIQFVVKGLNLY